MKLISWSNDEKRYQTINKLMMSIYNNLILFLFILKGELFLAKWECHLYRTPPWLHIFCCCWWSVQIFWCWGKEFNFYLSSINSIIFSSMASQKYNYTLWQFSFLSFASFGSRISACCLVLNRTNTNLQVIFLVWQRTEGVYNLKIWVTSLMNSP